jgi:polar amino acid transport system substrate-binding protein
MRQTLRVGAAVPDPPFNSTKDEGGLDISMMRAIAEYLGMAVEFVPFTGADFNEIFAVLNTGGYDCVTSGTTVTPERQRKAVFCEPYLISGQSLAVDVNRLPDVRSVDDLTTGACDTFMKLAPVLTELVHAVDGVDVVQRGLSTEQIATAVRFSDTELLQSINAAQAEL